MKRICPEILIISNTQDYSTDHVCYNLNQEGVPYLRLDRDLLSLINICLIPEEQRILGECESFSFEVTSELLKSVYYRAPVYLRDNYQPHLDPDIQLSRNQAPTRSARRSIIVFAWVLSAPNSSRESTGSLVRKSPSLIRANPAENAVSDPFTPRMMTTDRATPSPSASTVTSTVAIAVEELRG